MKIALCFSGMLRTHEVCLPTVIEHVIKANPQHQFDSFVATWDVRGKNVHWWNQTQDVERVDFSTLYKFAQDLNLKSVRVDGFIGSDFMKMCARQIDINGKYARREGHPSNPMNFLPMLWKIEQAHKLMMDNPVDYDLVVRLRTDLKFTGKFEIKEPQLNTIFMPDHENWGPPPGYNDQLLYGTKHVMTYHAAMYQNLDLLYHSGTPSLHPETLIARHLGNVSQLKLVKHTIPYRIER